MNRPQLPAIKSLQFWLVRGASLFVPQSQRALWLEEWTSEFWYARQSCVQNSRGRACDWQLTLFCLGAFKDANWIRTDQTQSTTSLFDVRSPLRFILHLMTLATLTVSLALIVPGSRHALLPMPSQDTRSLAMISTNNASSDQQSNDSSFSISIDKYRSWRDRENASSKLAFYQPMSGRIRVRGTETQDLQIARASDNLFDVLNVALILPVKLRKDHLRSVVLSESVWHKYFVSNPQIVGSMVEVFSEKAIVVGIVPDASWRLPFQTDAWLLEDKEHVEMYSTNSYGYVVARVSPLTLQAHPHGYWQVTMPTHDGKAERMTLISLGRLRRNDLHVPLSIFLYPLLLACLALPAITSVSFGHWAECTTEAKRNDIIPWFFLITNCVLMLPTVCFGAILLAHLGHAETSDNSQMLMCFGSFLGFLFAFRWAFEDQRMRCPRCMQALASPARVGQTSQSFLAWSGTELICINGHGLLHVPDFETSWFNKQRWLSLDASWQSLFLSDPR
jgi:hypothetical protein